MLAIADDSGNDKDGEDEDDDGNDDDIDGNDKGKKESDIRKTVLLEHLKARLASKLEFRVVCELLLNC